MFHKEKQLSNTEIPNSIELKHYSIAMQEWEERDLCHIKMCTFLAFQVIIINDVNINNNNNNKKLIDSR